MPRGYMFSHYWPGDGEVGEPPPAASEDNPYPRRQVGNFYMYGGFPIVPENWQEKIIKFVELGKFIWRIWKLVRTPEFEKAQEIVREVAHTPNMNNGRAWASIGSYMGKQPGVGENIHRHLLATQKWGPEVPYTRETRDTLLQLAYFQYKKPVKRG